MQGIIRKRPGHKQNVTVNTTVLCMILMLISIRIEKFACIWCSPFIYVDLNTYPLCLDLRESEVGVFAVLPFEFFSLCRTACMYVCKPSEQTWCECKSLVQWKQCGDKHQWAGSPGYMNCAWTDFRKDFSCWWLSGFQRKHWNKATWLQGQVRSGYKMRRCFMCWNSSRSQ